ncbi:DUF6014 family protein [Fischerella sp. PCC 9605]|uniref:DUF6014 family protein n=1 Tax=Fischerella sp. PCC 9605 TaxID=1173024 RepID=UPI0004B0FCCC|nr:DUF6014 family protein [Fischerella sp. PCC 9605]
MTQIVLIDKEVTNEKELTIASNIIWKLEKNQLTDAILLFDKLTDSKKFPKDWIQATEYALRTEDWAALSESFIRKEFIGSEGYFLIIAPHKLCREQGETVELSALLGKVIPINSMPFKQVEEQAINVFGRLLQPITEVIPCICLCSCNHFNYENSEAFIVPESWAIPGSLEGPIINNMTQHRKRFHQLVQKNIPSIFEPETANLLLDSLADEAVGLQRQHIEYQYHDAGHATGLGIRRKVQDNLLLTYWCAAIEEWRADSVEFDLAHRTLPIEEVGKLIAANFCLRFGIDAQRWGGSDFDSHATSCLLTLEYLFSSGALCIKQGQLALRNPNYQSLAKAVEIQRAEAVCLTQEELSLEHLTGIVGLYQSIKVHKSTKEIFREFVILPCQ